MEKERLRCITITLLVSALSIWSHGSGSAIHKPPTATSTASPYPRPVNCSAAALQQYEISIATAEPGVLVHVPGDLLNCPEQPGGPEIRVSRPGEEYSQWKNNIIVGCTVAAAIEVVIVVVIILYWRQIRWTLRKIFCPCGSQRNTSDVQEPTERQSPDSSQHSPTHDIEQTQETEMLNYGGTRRGRDSEDEIDSHDLELAPHLDQRSGVLEYEDYYSRDSSSIDGHSHTARRFIAGHKPDSMSYASAINYYQISSECGSSYGPPAEELSNASILNGGKATDSNVDGHASKGNISSQSGLSPADTEPATIKALPTSCDNSSSNCELNKDNTQTILEGTSSVDSRQNPESMSLIPIP